MSILADINALQNKKSLFDSILEKGQLDIENKYKLEILKEEMLHILSNIFSIYSKNILSTSFYLQVNQIENSIYELIQEKNKALKLAQEQKEQSWKIIKKMITFVYLIDLLQNHVPISMNIEKRLLDLKNNILNKNLLQKRICALKFIEDTLPCYITNLKKLLQIVSEFPNKRTLPFEKRQEIFELFTDISLAIQFDKNHSKMFNEDLYLNDISTMDYIKWYETIFLSNCERIGLKLSSYETTLSELLQNHEISLTSILSYIDELIAKKYHAEIKWYHKTIDDFLKKSDLEMKMQLSSCFTCNGDSNFTPFNLTDSSFSTDPWKHFKHKQLLQSILQKKKITIKNNLTFLNMKDKLCETIQKNFCVDDYLDIYYANLKHKNKQIAGFEEYYNEILEISKKQLIKNYIDELNHMMDIEIAKPDSFLYAEKNYFELQNQIEELDQALAYINKDYRDFKETHLKLYFNSIEKCYCVNHLYEKISARNSNFLYRLKAKRMIKTEFIFIETFLTDQRIVQNLKNILLEHIITSDELRNDLNKMLDTTDT